MEELPETRKGDHTAMINSIIYNIQEAFKGVWRNRAMAAASIASVASSLFVLGLVLIIVLNINNFASVAERQFDRIQLFLNEDLTPIETTQLKKDLDSINGVKKVEFESKDVAMEKLRERWGKDAYLLEGIENPLQNSFVVQLADLEKADSVVSSIKKLQGISDIKYYKDVVEKITRISDMVRNGGMIVIGLLSTVSLFIIANTIKIALYSRRREISIMKYIGATNWFIRWPFIIEGMILGAFGSILALSITYLIYDILLKKLQTPAYAIIGNYLLGINQIFGNMMNIFILMGIGIGILGSIVSLRRYLKV